MKKLRCAVVGLGMGKNHAFAFRDHPLSELVAVVDKDPERLGFWSGEAPGASRYEDYEAMLQKEKPDLVSIALPNFLHAPVGIKCLRAGAHILVEKPMAMSVREALEMEAAARDAGRQIAVNLSYRAGHAAQALKVLADDGFLGQPYHAYTRWTRLDNFPGFGGWFGQKALSGGGPLIDLGVHRIDLAMWLMGSPEPVSVSGQTHDRMGSERARQCNAVFDVEDFATGFIRFDNGASLLFEVSWDGHQEGRQEMETRVMGTGGTLLHRNISGRYEFEALAYSRIKGIPFTQRLSVPQGIKPDPFSAVIEALSAEKAVPVGPADGIRVQKILDGLYASAREGREIIL